MEGEKYLCPSCGMPVPADRINYRTRRAHCDFCGQEIIFPKRNSTASPSAVHALNQARDFFFSGDFNSALRCAQTVVEMVPKHAAALYIIAYHKAFVADIKNRVSLDNLFNEVLPDAEFEIEEEELFKSLLLKTMSHSIDYEEQILEKFVEYDDAKEVAEFMEQFCPYAISKRVSIEWFTPDLAATYATVSARTSIPKTCYALFTSLSKNPDSPLSDGTFYLKTKAKRFYDNYLLPVGKVINNMADQTFRAKFVAVYDKVRSQFENQMSE